MKALLIIQFLLFSIVLNGQTDSIHQNWNTPVEIDDSTEFFTSPDSLGVQRVYHANGTVSEEGKFKAKWVFPYGKFPFRHGQWKFYNAAGNLEKRGSYQKGDKDDLWEYFNDDGQLYRIELWNRGDFVEGRQYMEPDPRPDSLIMQKGPWLAD